MILNTDITKQDLVDFIDKMELKSNPKAYDILAKRIQSHFDESRSLSFTFKGKGAYLRVVLIGLIVQGLYCTYLTDEEKSEQY